MQPISAWPFLFRSLVIAASDTIDFFGWNLRTVLSTVVPTAFGFYLLYKVKGGSDFRAEVAQLTIITIAPTTIFLVGLFLFNCFRAPYKLYVSQLKATADEIASKSSEANKLSDELKAANVRIHSLEEEINKRTPPRITNPETPAGPSTANTTGGQANDDLRRRTIREQLGKFLLECQALSKRTSDESQPPPTAESNAWATTVEQYLNQNLGSEYVPRFRASSGLPMMVTSIQSNDHAKLWSGLQVRCARVQEFLKELSP